MSATCSSAGARRRQRFSAWRLVVTVYILMQAMAAGLERSSANTGDPRNVMIVRKGSTAESSSQVSREQLNTIQYWPQVERDAQGRPLVSGDLVVIMNLPRRDGTGEANVTMRGITPMGDRRFGRRSNS